MKIPKSIQADLALIAITFVWGSTFTVVKNSLAFISPILLVAVRFWIATAVIVIIMPGQIRKISAKSLCQGLILSVVLLGSFIFQTLGLRSTSPSYSAFITALSVLLVPLLGFIFFRDKPRLQTTVGVILATLGLWILLVNIHQMKAGSGEMLTLVCAFLFALQIVLLGHFVATTDYRQLMLLQMAGTAAAMHIPDSYPGSSLHCLALEFACVFLRHRNSGNRSRFLCAGAGTAVHDPEPHGADLQPGAVFCGAFRLLDTGTGFNRQRVDRRSTDIGGDISVRTAPRAIRNTERRCFPTLETRRPIE